MIFQHRGDLCPMTLTSNDSLLSDHTACTVSSRACPADVYYRRRPEVVGHHVTNDVIVLPTSADLVGMRATLSEVALVFLCVACGKTLFLSLFRDLGSARVAAHARPAGSVIKRGQGTSCSCR